MIIGIIQAQMGSVRLPGKSLMPVAGIPLLELVIKRCKRSNMVDKWILAITTEHVDDVLQNYCGLITYRGAPKELLAQFYFIATRENADVIVRVTADDPLKDPALIDKAVTEILLDSGLDYCSNTMVPTFPIGLDVEAFRFRALEKAYDEAILKPFREHVTPYMYKNPDIFKCKNFEHHTDLHKWRWTIDTAKDLKDMNALISMFPDPVGMSWEDAVQAVVVG